MCPKTWETGTQIEDTASAQARSGGQGPRTSHFHPSFTELGFTIMSSWKPQAPAPAEAARVLSSPVGNLTPGQQRWEAGLPEVQGLETPAGAFAGGVPESRVPWPLAPMLHSGAAAATLRGGKQALVRWVWPLGPGPGQLPWCTHRRHGSEALGRDPHRRRPGHRSHTPLPQQPRQPRGGWAWEAPSAPQSPQYTGQGGRRLDGRVAGGAPGEPRVDSCIPDCSGHAPHAPQIWTTSSTHATRATDTGHMLHTVRMHHRHGSHMPHVPHTPQTRATCSTCSTHATDTTCSTCATDMGAHEQNKKVERTTWRRIPVKTSARSRSSKLRCLKTRLQGGAGTWTGMHTCRYTGQTRVYTARTHEQGWQHADVTGLVHTHVIDL